MICLYCGYCCKNYPTIIIKDPEKGLIENNFEFNKGDGTPCKYLLGDKPGEYKCAVHDYPWYKEMPCFEQGQVEKSPDTPCRMGKYILEEFNKTFQPNI